MRILSPFYFKIIALLSINLDLFRIIKQKAMKKIKPKLIVIFLILTLLILFFLKKLEFIFMIPPSPFFI